MRKRSTGMTLDQSEQYHKIEYLMSTVDDLARKLNRLCSIHTDLDCEVDKRFNKIFDHIDSRLKVQKKVTVLHLSQSLDNLRHDINEITAEVAVKPI